jgi:hypothetical protein
VIVCSGSDLARSPSRRCMTANCANLPFIAIAKGPEAAPKLSSPRARRLSFDPQPGSVYIISRGAAAARLVHLAFATETPTLTIVDDATLHATALDRRRRMFNFCFMEIETLGVARSIGCGRCTCAAPRATVSKTRSVGKRVYRKLLDLETLVATRGPNFPLSRLESRLMCPACGNRRVTVVFEPPTNSQVIG